MEANGAGAAEAPEVIEPERETAGFIALYLLGVVLFSPLLLSVFDVAGARVAGVPLLFVYLFAAWAVLIALTAWLSRRIGDPPTAAPLRPEPPSDGG